MDRNAGERFRVALAVSKQASKEYGRDLVSRMAAAISYRTMFALAPMLVVAVSVAGLVLGGNAEAQAAITEAIAEVAGAEVAETVSNLLERAFESADTAALIGIAILLWSSSTLFLELQRALNDIFDMPLPEEKRLRVLAVQRGVGVLWTVGVGILLIALFAVNAATQIAGDTISRFLDVPEALVSFAGFVVSFAFMVLVFGIIFQTLTIGKIPWKAVWVGAGFTAVAFAIAGFLTGLYFELFEQPTALGVTSSIVVLLFLAYGLSSVFLFGAQVSHSYWELVYDADESHLLFLDEAEPEAAPEESSGLSMTALAAFVIGFFIGRTRRK